MNKFFYFTIAFIFIIGQSLYAQDSIAFIHVIHKVEKDKIILRWAPSSPGAWHSSMRYGYKIERIANLAKSEEMNKPTLIADKILPWGKEKWTKENVDSYDKYCIIAAELMYGNKSDKAINGKLLQKSDDFKNRYTYAMMSADFSHQAADALGLRYEDKDIKPGYTYIYKIISLTPDSIYPINKGRDIVYSSILDTMPAPQFHHVESGDHLLHLFWSKEQDIISKYTAFYIEKSEDGKTFKRLNENPYISSNQFGERFNQYFIYSDSLIDNYKYYGYRLIGITPFGELSPVSEVVFAAGRDLTPPLQASKLKSTQLPEGKMQIEWTYNDTEEKQLKGFLIGRSVNSLDSFENITPIMLPPNTRKFIDEYPNQLRSNFYFVTAIDTAGNYAISQSHYAHLIDSIAPKPPINIKGEAQINGTLKLTWDKNSEADILGYTVHYSNHPDHVFAAVTNKPVLINEYQDTVMIKTLSENLYYKIVAIDKSYNYSDFSEVIIVSIPDVVNPAVALAKNYDRRDKSINIEWINSTSDDVVKHVLYRKDSLNGVWQNIFETTNLAIRNYEDFSIKPSVTYYYKVHAIDDSNLESSESTILKVISSQTLQDLEDLNLRLIKDKEGVLLEWQKLKNVKRYLVYKANIEGKFVLLQSLTDSRIRDRNPIINGSYALRVINQDGIYSGFSKTVIFTQN